MSSYDTIVVGLGAAGTSAASTLARAGRRVLALEAQDRVGGRVWTRPLGDGVVELGAEWIHGQEASSVYALASRREVRLRAQELTFEVRRSDGARADDALMAELIDYCLEVMEGGSDVEESLGDLIERKFKAYLAEKRPALLRDTEFMENFLEFISLLVNNHEAADDWRDVTALSGYRALAGHQHVSWHRLGYRTLFDIMLNTYNDGPGLPTLDVKLNKEVTGIQWPQQPDGKAAVTCADGDRYTADNVIVTVSLGVLKERHAALFSPPLPPEKVDAIQNIAIGVMDKVILAFERAWWSKSAAFYGFVWRDAERRRLRPDERWLTRVFGASSAMGTSNTLTLWTSGEVAKMVETLPEEEVKSKLVGLLQRFMGSEVTVPPPTAMLRSTWYSSPWTRGSYSYDDVRGPRGAARRALAAPLRDARGVPRVLFAGEATDLTHFSTVHGACDSGQREARRLLPSPPASKM